MNIELSRGKQSYGKYLWWGN